MEQKNIIGETELLSVVVPVLNEQDTISIFYQTVE